MPQNNYCRQIVEILIGRAYPEIISVPSRPANNFQIPDEIRFDEVRHYPITFPATRCVLCGKAVEKHLINVN